jgi:hypothetical protein
MMNIHSLGFKSALPFSSNNWDTFVNLGFLREIKLVEKFRIINKRNPVILPIIIGENMYIKKVHANLWI